MGSSGKGCAEETLRGDDLLSDRLFVHVRLNDFIVQAIKREFKPVRDAKLVIDLAQVILDDLLGGAQLESNLLISLALRDAGDDRHFLRRKAGLIAGADERSRLGAIGIDHPIDRLIIDPSFTGADAAHAAHEQVRRYGTGYDAADAAPVKLDS